MKTLRNTLLVGIIALVTLGASTTALAHRWHGGWYGGYGWHGGWHRHSNVVIYPPPVYQYAPYAYPYHGYGYPYYGGNVIIIRKHHHHHWR